MIESTIIFWNEQCGGVFDFVAPISNIPSLFENISA